MLGFTPRILVLAALSMGPLLGVSATSAQEIVRVETDQASILKLPVPATTIIIGNPVIADAAVFDINTLIVTGKSFGSTNLIVLDGDSNIVAEYNLMVSGTSAGQVVVYRGNQRNTFACAPDCERALSVGDDSDTFEAIAKQTQTRLDMSLGQSVDDE